MEATMEVKGFAELSDFELEEVDGGWIEIVGVALAGITFCYGVGYALGAAFRPY